MGLDAGRFVAFSTLGVLSVTQDLAGAILEDVVGADPELVAEETLCLVATATARAAEVALREHPSIAELAASALIDIPFIYRDYLLGSEMLRRHESTLAELGDEIYARLQRKREFYAVHFPPGQFPGERTLTDKMGLWMGRISPPKLPELPTERLEKLELVDTLLRHLKLVRAYGGRGKE
ncbi:MAG: hypothetical protein WED81_03895 [Rhodothermales bacterium]